MKFRKRTVVIDAVQWFRHGDNPDVTFYVDEKHLINTGETCKEETYGRPCARLLIDHGWIKTKEGGHIVCPNDWIITGVKGEKYPCKPDIFERTYEPDKYIIPLDIALPDILLRYEIEDGIREKVDSFEALPLDEQAAYMAQSDAIIAKIKPYLKEL